MYKKRKIPDPTIERLPIYFRCLNDLKKADVSIVSSDEIASRAGIKASQFRKDLSYFGEFGIQGLGYPVAQLLGKIASLMQLDKEHNMVIAGAGHLGQALARYGGFVKWGYRVAGIYDNDPEKVGLQVGGLTVEPISSMPDNLDASIGVIAVPSSAAQEVASRLSAAGVKGMLNFTGVKVEAPQGVVVRNVDVTNELAILNYYLASRR
jgi:redox-sensing transcriptional repressor